MNEQIDVTGPPTRVRKRRVGNLVTQRVEFLISQRESKKSSARATLAALRNAVVDTPGNRPELWDITSVHISENEFVGDDPTWDEIAVHSALCLFARHQQSRRQMMHQKGIGLGVAAKQLVLLREDKKYNGVRRYFVAAATATSVRGLIRHLSSIVSLFRQENIPLDYGALAEDIFQFQVPGGAKIVRLRWARQYAKTTTISQKPDDERGK